MMVAKSRCVARIRRFVATPSCAFFASGGTASKTLKTDPDTWPDGTPKKFRGREAWKNWINWDSKFKEQTDELNRMRHFFWEVDEKGALWRLELDHPGKRFGQIRHAKVLDEFFGYIQPNQSSYHEDEFPFVSQRTHEHYFVRWAKTMGREKDEMSRSPLEVPIVFNDLREGELRHICPGSGEIARRITTTFDPRALRLSLNGCLLHPVWTFVGQMRNVSGHQAAVENFETRPSGRLTAKRRCYFAAVDVTTAQQILEHVEEVESNDISTQYDFVLHWEGKRVPLHYL